MPSAERSARVYFHTLGCPKNDADSRAMMRALATEGATVVNDPSVATHVVINTCGFIQDAKEESIAAILSACDECSGAQVLVMGCMVERHRQELLKGIPEVSGWLGVAGDEVASQLAELVLGDGRDALRLHPRSYSEKQSYAYVKIADGCDEGCTFCAIPGFKGPYVSVATEEILREADACLADGAKELVLVGQDTTRWSSYEGLDLRGLVDLLAEDDRVRRIRVMYLQPARLSIDFLEFMAEHDKLCRYLDVPFQHSHREILRQMGRPGEGETYLRLLATAREMMPSVALRSTFIVGFPGEEENHFQHLLGFVRDARFDYGGAFVYSPEEGTAAARLRQTVGARTGQERLNSLNEALLGTGERAREELVGTEIEVMIDSIEEVDLTEDCVGVGRTEGQAPEVDGVTYIRGSAKTPLTVGEVVRARITEVLGCDMVGDISET